MKTTQTQLPQFGLCLNNDGYAASLEIGKLYRVIRDDDVVAQGYLRVIDESGEEYAYAANRFYLIHLPTAVEEALLSASQS
jgi:hypothetical protein